jgi:hypothetical protein
MTTDTTGNRGREGTDGHPASSQGTSMEDILVGAVGEELSQVTAAETDPQSSVDSGEAGQISVNAQAPHGESLQLGDVLAEAGESADALAVYLKVETIGGNTIVSVGSDSAGASATIPIVTLEGVTGVTLQDLLSPNQLIT